MYAAMMPPDTWAIPLVMTHINSDFVSLFRNGRIVRGASVCPMKMLAATFSDSAPLAPITRVMSQAAPRIMRSEEHTSELQSRLHLVCRLLLEKKKKQTHTTSDASAKHVHHFHNTSY